MTKVLDKLARNISSKNLRTAGRIEFVRDQGPLRCDEHGNPQAILWLKSEEPELDPWTWEPIQKQSSKKPFSDLPTNDSYQEERIIDSEYFENTTGRVSNYDTAIRKTIKNQKFRQASKRKADSSIDPGSLPGPRIDHIGH